MNNTFNPAWNYGGGGSSSTSIQVSNEDEFKNALLDATNRNVELISDIKFTKPHMITKTIPKYIKSKHYKFTCDDIEVPGAGEDFWFTFQVNSKPLFFDELNLCGAKDYFNLPESQRTNYTFFAIYSGDVNIGTLNTNFIPRLGIAFIGRNSQSAGGVYVNSAKILNANLTKTYCGFGFFRGYEYSSVNNIKSRDCYMNVITNSGNTTYNGCDFTSSVNGIITTAETVQICKNAVWGSHNAGHDKMNNTTANHLTWGEKTTWTKGTQFKIAGAYIRPQGYALYAIGNNQSPTAIDGLTCVYGRVGNDFDKAQGKTSWIINTVGYLTWFILGVFSNTAGGTNLRTTLLSPAYYVNGGIACCGPVDASSIPTTGQGTPQQNIMPCSRVYERFDNPNKCQLSLITDSRVCSQTATITVNYKLDGASGSITLSKNNLGLWTDANGINTTGKNEIRWVSVVYTNLSGTLTTQSNIRSISTIMGNERWDCRG